MTNEKKTVWQIDCDGSVTEVVVLSQKRGDYKEGQWLIPAGCVEVEPPEEKEGFVLRWNGDNWGYYELELAEEADDQEKELEETTELLLMRLNNEFENDNQEILNAFVKARMKDNVNLQEELKIEMVELEKEYKLKKQVIENGENPWEVKNHA